MDKKQKESGRPMAIAIGAHLVCCVGLVLFATGAISFTGWLGGFDALGVLGIAVAVGAVVLLLRRGGGKPARADEPPSSARQAIGEDR